MMLHGVVVPSRHSEVRGLPDTAARVAGLRGQVREVDERLDHVGQRIGRDDRVHRLADQVLGPPAQQLLDRPAHPAEHAVVVDDGERVDGGLGDGAVHRRGGLVAHVELDRFPCACGCHRPVHVPRHDRADRDSAEPRNVGPGWTGQVGWRASTSGPRSARVRPPGEGHRHVHLAQQAPQDVLDAGLPAEAEAVDVGPPVEDRGGAQRHGLDHVGAGAHARVEQDRDGAADRLEHPRQRVERRDGAVDLAAAVVGHDDAVHSGLHRGAGVVGVQDALEHDGQRGLVPQPGEVVPGQRRVAEDARPAEHLVEVLGVGAQRGGEGRVGEVVGDAHALKEREVGRVEVGGPPPQHERVERDDEGRVPGGLGPAHERRGHLALVRPVELVPPLARRPRPRPPARSSGRRPWSG